MVKVVPISQAQPQQQPPKPGMSDATDDKRKEKVIAAGGAAGLGTKATQLAGKGKQLPGQIGQIMSKAQQTVKTVNDSSKAAKGLWAGFKSNIEFYTKDILRRLESLKKVKFIGPIIKSPIMKKMAGFAGGVLAFFVFITGVNDAVRTGAIAVGDLKKQYNELRTAA
jgi:hypothetical protein